MPTGEVLAPEPTLTEKRTARVSGEIPRTIWQTWKHRTCPHPLKRCARSFQIHNPSWGIDLSTDEEIDAFIGSEFPELENVIARFPRGVYVADIWRCLVLYRFGGVYADLDVECIQPLDDLLEAIESHGLNHDGSEVFLPREHPVHEAGHYDGREMYMNFFMLAKPGSRFFKAYIDRLVRIASEGDGKIEGKVIELTGPGAFAELVEEAGSPESLGLSIIPWEWVSPLPNMSNRWDFEGRREYDDLIRRGDWAWEKNPFLAHYWWHNYTSPRSMITMYGSLLFQSDGSIVSRRLDRILPDSDPRGELHGRALAEFAELEDAVCVLSRLPDESGSLSALAKKVFEGLDKVIMAELPGDGTGVGLIEVNEEDIHSLSRLENALAGGLFVHRGLVCGSGLRPGPGGFRDKLLQITAEHRFDILEESGGLLLRAPDPAERVLIPKVIHQTWKTRCISDPFRQEWVDSWMDKNRCNGWEYRFWTDEDLLALVEEEFPDFLECYLHYDHPIKRVDAARYLILKRYGGLFVDLDFVCLKAFDDLLLRQGLLFGTEHDFPDLHHDSVCNALMGSIPGHPFWAGIEADLKASASQKVLAATGPVFLGQRLRDSHRFLERENFPTIFRKETFYPFRWNDDECLIARDLTVEELAERYPSSYAVTLWTGTWLSGASAARAEMPGKPGGVGDHLIPRSMWQVSSDPARIPQQVLLASQSLKKQNPGWSYELHNAESVSKALRAFLPEKACRLYESIPDMEFKTDIVRFALLAEFGGLFCDLRFLCRQGLDELLWKYPGKRLHVGCDNSGEGFSKAVILAAPSHPVVKRALDLLIQSAEAGNPSGKVAWQEALKEFFDCDESPVALYQEPARMKGCDAVLHPPYFFDGILFVDDIRPASVNP